ncbi:uncharacterized protein RHOBADRAFT_64361 [Rhodotorula graminis WP1]|uniref:N-acetyltransferase domain-containing protein n=1 Tax=Rhodotorula graminis (strain WP1) TaxID=578459 RepID=A0A194SCB3_RHOGW|nr:uncharacterized protein RHOBADRAFT_64361 [Rhodotorula graminis WP1]KPV78242.1 hypothetical protein RHOBADRAFT_64361 [Rhodotorula graminis WP1]
MTATRTIELVPFDPDRSTEVEELKRQRVLCGWGSDKVEVWRDQVRRGVKNLYWIFPTDRGAYKTPEFEPINHKVDEAGPPPPDLSFQPIGHVSVDWEDYDPNETTLCDRENGVCTLASFFILLSQQGKGLGSLVMKEMELKAKHELGARSITLNTIDGEYASQPWWWEQQGLTFSAATRNNEQWYQRLGYTAYKRAVPRYPTTTVDGRDILLEAVFMRKELQ